MRGRGSGIWKSSGVKTGKDKMIWEIEEEVWEVEEVLGVAKPRIRVSE